MQHLEAQLQQPTPTWSKEKYSQLPHTPRGLNKRDLICFQCSQPGHLRRNCPLFSGPKQIGPCYLCGQMGHHQRHCGQRPIQPQGRQGNNQPLHSPINGGAYARQEFHSNSNRTSKQSSKPTDRFYQSKPTDRFYQINGLMHSLTVEETVDGVPS